MHEVHNKTQFVKNSVMMWSSHSSAVTRRGRRRERLTGRRTSTVVASNALYTQHAAADSQQGGRTDRRTDADNSARSLVGWFVGSCVVGL